MAPVVIVTGASRGLGAAMAQSSAEMGADVVLTARSQDELDRQAELIRRKGREALVVVADLNEPQDCRSVVQQALQCFGALHALINNGGILEPMATIAQADPQAWLRNWQVNLLAPVLLTQEALPALRISGGRVVNVSSGAAEKVTPGWAAYSLAKAALNHLTRFLAQEEPGITALSVRPGVVDTAMQAAIRAKGGSQCMRMITSVSSVIMSKANCSRRDCPHAPWLAWLCMLRTPGVGNTFHGMRNACKPWLKNTSDELD
jgi:NAD(P)-dependent dehydrogenase (short-subunit alcohol dehydrogenase family)